MTRQLVRYSALLGLLLFTVLQLGAKGNGCFSEEPEEVCTSDTDCAYDEVCSSEGTCIDAPCVGEGGHFLSPYTGQCIAFDNGCDVPPGWQPCEPEPVECGDLAIDECEANVACMLEEQVNCLPTPCYEDEMSCVEMCEVELICVERTIEPCSDLNEDECVADARCQPIYTEMPTRCGDEDIDCMPFPVDYVGCELADPCATLDEDECLEQSGCHPVYGDWDEVPCDLPEGVDPEGCILPAPEFLFCETDSQPERCEDLPMEVCEQTPGCHLETLDCLCYDDDELCDCYPYAVCVSDNPDPCTGLSLDECEWNPTCEPIFETEPCYCEDDYCACPELARFVG